MTGPTIETASILFCDDDPFFSEMGMASLEGSGFSVTTVANGQEALGQISKRSFDLVVLDVHMPGISGFTVLEEIRGNAATRMLPVMVVTGNDDAESVQKAFNLGANAFMAKPFDWALLVHQVSFLLKSSRMEADLRASTRSADMMRKMQEELVKALMEQAQRPLEVAMGLAILLKEEAGGANGPDHVQAWVEELCEAIEQVSDAHLRVASRAGADQALETLEDEEFGLAQYLTKLGVWLDGAIQDRDVDFSIRVEVEDGLRASYDAVLLTHALKSILTHTLEAAEPGTTLEVVCSTSADENVVITVYGYPAGGAASDEASEDPGAHELHYALGMAERIAIAHGGKLSCERQAGRQAVMLEIPNKRLVASEGEAVFEGGLRDVSSETNGISEMDHPVASPEASGVEPAGCVTANEPAPVVPRAVPGRVPRARGTFGKLAKAE